MADPSVPSTPVYDYQLPCPPGQLPRVRETRERYIVRRSTPRKHNPASGENVRDLWIGRAMGGALPFFRPFFVLLCVA